VCELDFFVSEYKKVAGFSEQLREPPGSIKFKILLQYIRAYYVLKNDSVSWI
jgi:hypothetical protein